VRRLRLNQPETLKRSGVVILEFIIAAPIVFIAMLAIFQFGFLALTLQFGHAALIEGTRRAAELYPPNYPLVLDTASPDNDIADSVVNAVNQYLAVHCMEIYDPTQGFPDDPERANAQIVTQHEGVTVTRGEAVTFPDGFVCTPAGNPPDMDEVRVTLCFPLVDPDDPDGCGDPVPDWLSVYGFSLGNCVFEVSSRMRLE